MKDLIAKLEDATEGSRELDAEISAAIGNVVEPCGANDWAVLYGTKIVEGSEGRLEDEDWRELEHYTTSLDAALTLVPEGYLWQIKQAVQCCALVWALEVDYDDHPVPTGYSTTHPALALTIAALKARSAQ